MALAGLDVGTSGCKVTVFSEKGDILSYSYREYNVIRSGGYSELDPLEIWDKVKDVITEAFGNSKEKVTAISVSSLGESAVHIDIKGRILGNSILYSDPRGKEECEKLILLKNEEQIAQIVGVYPNEMYTIPKIIWRKNHQKELFDKTYKILLFGDYVIYMLTGEFFIDYSLASRTMAFNIRENTWSEEILNLAELRNDIFSAPVISGTNVGKIKEKIAEELNINDDVQVVTGAHDQVCSALGAGVTKPGLSTDGIGTVECITPVFDRPITNSKMQKFGYACVPYAIKGLFVTYAFSNTGGALVKWFRDNFAMGYEEKAKAKNMSVFQYLDALVTDKPSGLLVMPHFAGAATPYMNSEAKSAILGLKLESGNIDLYRAVLEGVTYEILLNIEHLEKAGVCINELYATGGGASSPTWLQIKADILGRPISSLKNTEAGTAGAAMLAGVGTGIYKDMEEAKDWFVKVKKTFEPRKEMTDEYMAIYENYRRIYSAVKDVYHY